MNKKIINYDTNIDHEIYSTTFAKWPKLIIISFLLFTIGLVSNFPLKHYIKTNVTKALKLNRRCQILSQDIQTSLIFANIKILRPTIPSHCFRGPEISFKEVTVGFRGPSFIPLGLRFKSNLLLGTNELPIYFVISSNKIKIQVDNSNINIKNLLESIKLNQYLNGNLEINANLDVKKTKLTNGDFKIKSTNISIPSQVISGFNLPDLNLKNFLVRGSIVRDNLMRIQEIIIGNENSPIIAKIKGDINLSSNNLAYSKLKLNGNVKFSTKFLKDFSFLNLLLAQNKAKNGFYSFVINGTLFKPLTKFK